MPKLRYSFAPEIYEHAQRIGQHFGLYEDAVFQTWVTELRWLEDERRWLVQTNHGDEMRARHICLGTGPANRPRLPGIPGVEGFKGHSFHTCRWDYDYTGGSHEGNLTKLADRTVAIIGTGATAVQCVPALGESAKQLYVFQRTPSSVDVRNNAETDPEWAASLKPGWQKERQKKFGEAFWGPNRPGLYRRWLDQTDSQRKDPGLQGYRADIQSRTACGFQNHGGDSRPGRRNRQRPRDRR